ncbi:MAG: hypothetical protein K6F32_04440, partial [Bacilli bacterium]|nr:hypothetical protein [Bacilli bacterium]
GFANTSIERLRELGEPVIFICIILMLIGGGSGSTAGGIKMYRVVIMMRQVTFALVHRFDPEHKKSPFLTYRHGKTKEITQGQVIESFSYMMIFLAVYFVSVIICCFLPEMGVENSCFDVASAISNVGSSLDDFVAYSVNYPGEWIALSWTLAITMILGRLEVIPIINAARNVYEEAAFKHKKRISRRKAMASINEAY